MLHISGDALKMGLCTVREMADIYRWTCTSHSCKSGILYLQAIAKSAYLEKPKVVVVCQKFGGICLFRQVDGGVVYRNAGKHKVTH